MTSKSIMFSNYIEKINNTIVPPNPKRIPFIITDNSRIPTKFRILSINFNNAIFQQEAGYDDADFCRKVNELSKFMRIMVESYHVKVINVQEFSSRFMHIEKIRSLILENLNQINKSFTATPACGQNKQACSAKAELLKQHIL
jgi:hypothetical protein